MKSAIRKFLGNQGPRYWQGVRFARRVRRDLLVVRIRFQAAAKRAHVDLDIAPDAGVGRRVSVDIEPGTSNRLVIGSRVRVHDDVTLWLRGGSIEIGPEVILRRGATLTSAGRLRIGEASIIGHWTMTHCAEDLEFGKRAMLAEHASVTDNYHPRTMLHVQMLHVTRSKPTKIGEGVFIFPRSVVAAGVTIGEGAVVGALSVVTKDVDPWWMVAGNPAVPVRQVEPVPDEV